MAACGQTTALRVRSLGPRKGGSLPRNTLHRVIEALADTGDTPVEVLLGESPIEVSNEPVVPIGRVVDAPGGVRLYVEQDPGIEQVFRNGAAICRGPRVWGAAWPTKAA